MEIIFSVCLIVTLLFPSSIFLAYQIGRANGIEQVKRVRKDS